MSPRERVRRVLSFGYPDRVPRDLWTLPIALNKYEKEVKAILEMFPLDIRGAEYGPLLKGYTKGGSPYEIGTYVDEWRCVFESIQRGVHGQVKVPLISEWSDLDKLKVSYGLLGKGMAKVPERF